MRFRTQRKKAGLAVAEVAQALRVSEAAVYQWETGVSFPAGKRLVDIARLYGCTVDELLQAEGTPERP